MSALVKYLPAYLVDVQITPVMGARVLKHLLDGAALLSFVRINETRDEWRRAAGAD